MDKEQIKQFIIQQRQNGIPDEQIYSFLQSKGVVQTTQPEQPKKSFVEKVAGFVGGEKIAQGLGQGLIQGELQKGVDDIQKMEGEQQAALIEAIRKNREAGKDTTRLENALRALTGDIEATGVGAEKMLNPNELTPSQVAGDALQLATTVGSVGSFGKGFVSGGKEATLKNIVSNTGRQKAVPSVFGEVVGANTFKEGVKQGAKAGAVAGGAFGASTGVSQALEEDKKVGEVLESGLTSGLTGVLTGSALGGVIGGTSGALKGRELRKAVLDNQYAVGDKAQKANTAVGDKAQKANTAVGDKAQKANTAVKEKAIQMAKQQGFDDVDVEFINSLSRADKAKAKQMLELAQKATRDKRLIERPIDIVGDSMTQRIKFIQNKNNLAGKAVEQTAKTLRGQVIDASAVRQQAFSLLEDAGVFVDDAGNTNWTKSIFKKTPELEKKLRKALADLPTGEIDAYELHNFKKSIDELVNYGVGGEGLKGKSANILKGIRNTADEVLDNTFQSYNQANTDYKITREVLDQANELFGKKVGIVKERGGQLLRSVFSNNTQRPRVLTLIEQLEETSKLYGGRFRDNLIDQALFTEILEDIYGTQATTSLQGQVSRAVKGTQRVIEAVRDPLKGAGDLLATGAEKLIGISDENKRKVLEALLR